jgi:hypothetical protein
MNFRLESSTSVDADTVITLLAGAFPGTRVTCDDFYGERIAECELRGLPADSPPVLRLRQYRADEGIMRVFEVPIGEGLMLKGRLGSTGGEFVSNTVCLRRQVQPLIDLLSAAGLRVIIGAG